MRLHLYFGPLVFAATALIQTGAPVYDELRTGCRRVTVSVFVEDEAQSLGVAESERLETMDESRLRAARLYQPQQSERLPVLNVDVEALVGDATNAYTVQVEFYRIMLNPDTERGVAVATWRRGSFGYFGSRAKVSDSVQATVSDFVDEFILDYLRVNEDSCD